MSYWFWTPEKLTREQVEQMVREAKKKGKSLYLDRVNLNRVDLSRVDLSQANLNGVNLTQANLSEAGLLEAHLNRTILSGANLSQADLTQAYLFQADLTGANLRRAYLSEARLSEAKLSEAKLRNADLSQANLSEATLTQANLSRANLSRTNFSQANLTGANLTGANLTRANLTGANLTRANLTRTKLDSTNFSKAIINRTYFIEVDLSQANGLTNADHKVLPIIDINTIYQSKDKIPKEFLEKAGVHPDIIRWQHSLHTRPTVFISYSHHDEKEKDELLVHLRALEREDLITVWHDELIGPGTDWKQEIKQAIAQASVAILLITPHFLASEFIQEKEIPEFLKRRESDENLVIFPVIAKHCAWKRLEWLANLQVKPKGGQPVWDKSQAKDIDAELANLSEEVIEIIRNLWLR